MIYLSRFMVKNHGSFASGNKPIKIWIGRQVVNLVCILRLRLSLGSIRLSNRLSSQCIHFWFHLCYDNVTWSLSRIMPALLQRWRHIQPALHFNQSSKCTDLRNTSMCVSCIYFIATVLLGGGGERRKVIIDTHRRWYEAGRRLMACDAVTCQMASSPTPYFLFHTYSRPRTFFPQTG